MSDELKTLVELLIAQIGVIASVIALSAVLKMKKGERPSGYTLLLIMLVVVCTAVGLSDLLGFT